MPVERDETLEGIQQLLAHSMNTSMSVRTCQWVERVRALAPAVEQWRDIGEQQRHMPQQLFEGLRAAGFFKMSVPAVFGGDDLDNVGTAGLSRNCRDSMARLVGMS
jgi:alkylation response protein AidB-like acyl-CoA dehydrogenase